ncbi:MAG: hypothetical protein C0478_01795 [Planctomyces sp.]|nr:hypothetical protein [Planctomyces sp.]
MLGPLMTGCADNSHQKSTASVKGTVSANGQPVTFGEIIFSPIATGAEGGKSAIGTIREDGTFTLATYISGDGAIIGQHRISISPVDPTKKLPGKLPKDFQLEVKPGSNTFEIKLEPLK